MVCMVCPEQVLQGSRSFFGGTFDLVDLDRLERDGLMAVRAPDLAVDEGQHFRYC